MTRQLGATKLEFALTVAIFGVLGALLLQRLALVEEYTERTEGDVTIRNIRTGIQLAIGERIVRGEQDRLAEVAAASPVDLLGKHPRGFVTAPAATAAGQWAYDPQGRELSYLPRRPGTFGDADRLRWRLVARTDAAGKVFGASLVRLN
jgi:hypothetical protein